MTFKIRTERSSDVSAIEAVTIAAFRNLPYSRHNEQLIIDRLRRTGNLAVSLVVEEGGMIVGHLAISPVTLSSGSSGWYGLGPVSIIPKRQGLGMGTALTRQALGELRELGAFGCVVLGDPRFYHRFGFKTESALVLLGAPGEYFQVLLFKGELPAGTVTYHNSFTE